MINIHEIKQRAHIDVVWAALGGGRLRGNRGQAFWRDGNGYSISLDVDRGLWHDFVSGEGGDVIALIETVHQCDFKQAIRWLADFTGMDLSASSRNHNRADTSWPADLKLATWWRMAAEALTENVLEILPSTDPERRTYTDLLRSIRLGDAALVDEYREWRRQFPKLTAGMVHAGKLHDASLQRRLAEWLWRTNVAQAD